VKRNGLIAGALVLALCILITPASAERFALGAYGGYQWPIAQDDADPGGLFGIKGKIKVAPSIEIEPNINWIKNGDTETDSGGTITAPEVTSYQLNGIFTFGGRFGLTAGLGWASLDLPITGSENHFAWNFGLTLEIPIQRVSLDISPRALIINHADGATRKHGYIQAGLNFWF
jgi:hypothetical protein